MPRYLSEIMKELPENCLFNKARTGCGGTSLAIECNKPFVIAVPYVNLVANKTKQYPNKRFDGKVLGVWKEVGEDAIKEYIKEVNLPKIITTYDGLRKVIGACDGDVARFNLLVDGHMCFCLSMNLDKKRCVISWTITNGSVAIYL